jgi:hypothetical protein
MTNSKYRALRADLMIVDTCLYCATLCPRRILQRAHKTTYGLLCVRRWDITQGNKYRPASGLDQRTSDDCIMWSLKSGTTSYH